MFICLGELIWLVHYWHNQFQVYRMLFNSIDFAIFLPIVFLLYWFVFNRRLKLRNAFVVLASYVFYAWWDWRFLSLILVSTIVDFSIGQLLKKEGKPIKRKIFQWISILVNLGLLGFFKYFNFFIENFTAAFSWFGMTIKPNTLNIILPVGISFYTFQTLSYTIDVYKRKFEACDDFIAFAAFVGFFPQLVAGPIERAKHLLPQFYSKRQFEYHKAVNGLQQILWGLFKKVVIADNCAEFVNALFSNPSDYSSGALILGAVFFTFQIYGDFSGYSDMAIGTARLFGFDIMQNFAYPFFSRDMAEFWRRWHISLSTWFRDYVYIPLGGSRSKPFIQVRNIFIIFLASGFWHGAKWTFIVWGALNAIYFLPLLLAKKNRKHIEVVAHGKLLPSFRDAVRILFTFGLTAFAFIIFRAASLSHAAQYISGIIQQQTAVVSLDVIGPYKVFILIIGAFVCIEWLGREQKFALEHIRLPRHWRWSIYLLLGLLVFALGNFNKTEFIYFAF